MVKQIDTIIDEIYDTTLEYISKTSKKERKAKGQFFTDKYVAKYMSSLASNISEDMRICDCGAGSGMLTAALCEQLVSRPVTNIHFDVYENDENILPLLKENIKIIERFMLNNGKKISFNIITDNFILYNKKYWDNTEVPQGYDIIISNPPYKKLSKASNEAKYMSCIVKGQPNIYSLFLALSAKLLNKQGQLIFINPRSFTTGAYFKEFRKWFVKNVYITNLHLFNSRDDIFDAENVLQEAIILRAAKGDIKPQKIIITSCNNSTLSDIQELSAPYEVIISDNDENCFIKIPTNENELNIIKFVHSWRNNLISLGFKLKTGPVVDFRTKENLIHKKHCNETNIVPLLWASNIVLNNIIHPVSSEKPQWIKDNDDTKGILLQNKNYIIVKRFTTKEENRRIQVAIYTDDSIATNKLGLENHLNYITKIGGEFLKTELLGLYVLFNSTIIDRYFRILNGSTQVNANEMNALPLPDLEDIRNLGKRTLCISDLTTIHCDKIMMDYFIKKYNLDMILYLTRITNQNSVVADEVITM